MGRIELTDRCFLTTDLIRKRQELEEQCTEQRCNTSFMFRFLF